ncbi:MAG TPA: 16S rRNA (cytosine(1402)-N(4))-methyltransferase RsmH, partial [Candidatus Saccharimonadales bacterium]|nr:16S rRNA (cytosine(1402)-N(4))-methyltransferase RsmH [Candidatus Saccharimonadales bacterium]
SYLDLTAGYGGHAGAILSRTRAHAKATLVDRDVNAILSLSDLARAGAELIHQDYASAAEQLVRDRRQFDLILVDLGVSSPQLDKKQRGFSFESGPLDMRMDQREGKTAADIVNRYPLGRLTDIIVRYGEEKPAQARRIAQAIVDSRPLQTTDELASVILKTHRGRWQRIHPATRTFQAIRIELNRELEQLEQLLTLLPKLLNPGGRVAVISFHSLEDRLVKDYFRDQTRAGYESELTVIGKPVKGSVQDVHNPRARSAMLRAAVKNKKKGAS